MKTKIITLACLILITIPSIYYLIIPGFYEPSDLHHLADIYEMSRAILSGQFPPRLGPDFTFGYGYPLFNYYYVLPFYLGALAFIFLGSLTFSFKFVFIISSFITVFGMYLLLREFFGKFPSFAGAALYLYTPFRAVEVYVRGAMGETLGIAILPFVLWGVVKVIKDPSNKKISLLGIIIALFLLSHNYFWLLSGFWILAFAGIMIYTTRNKISALKGLLFSGLIGLGLTFYWWFPAFTEYNLVSASTPFKLEDHFPFIKQLIIPSWGYGSSVWGPNDEISFQIGLVNIVAILILGVMLYLWLRKKNKYLLLGIFSLSGFLATLFFMNIRSLPLWKLLPIYQFVQFPWRLLFLTTLFTSIALALIPQSLSENWIKKISLIFIFFILVLYLGYFKPSKIFHKSDDDYLNRMFADQSISGKKDFVSEKYINWSEDYLLLPKWTEKRPGELPKHKFLGNSDLEILDIKKISLTNWEARVTADKDTLLTFNAYYFPGWVAYIDDRIASIKPGKPHGQIEIEIPEGEHIVKIVWKETLKRLISDFVSIIFLSLTVMLFVNNRNSNVKRS